MARMGHEATPSSPRDEGCPKHTMLVPRGSHMYPEALVVPRWVHTACQTQGGLSVHSVAYKSSTFSDGARSIATWVSVQSKGKSRAPSTSSYPRFFAVTPNECDGSFNSNVKPPGFRGIETAELAFMRSRTFALSRSPFKSL